MNRFHLFFFVAPSMAWNTTMMNGNLFFRQKFCFSKENRFELFWRLLAEKENSLKIWSCLNRFLRTLCLKEMSCIKLSVEDNISSRFELSERRNVSFLSLWSIVISKKHVSSVILIELCAWKTKKTIESLMIFESSNKNSSARFCLSISMVKKNEWNFFFKLNRSSCFFSLRSNKRQRETVKDLAEIKKKLIDIWILF